MMAKSGFEKFGSSGSANSARLVPEIPGVSLGPKQIEE